MAEKSHKRKNGAAKPRQNKASARTPADTIRVLFVEDTTTGEQYECEVPLSMVLSKLAVDFFESQGWEMRDAQGRALRAVVELLDRNNRDRTLRLRGDQTVGEAGLQDGDILRIFPEAIAGDLAAKIFISYRRRDSEFAAHAIYDELVSYFGKEAVFFDVDLPRGIDFHENLVEAVAQCNILLAIIGDYWLSAKDEAGQRRIDNPDDFVRIEIEGALSRNIPVIPVLVGQASIPTSQHLPVELRRLSRRQATEVRAGRDLHSHLERLVQDVKQALRLGRR